MKRTDWKYLADTLQHTPLDEYLGRLRKRYLLAMRKVRDVGASLMKKNDQGGNNDQSED